MKIDNGEEEIGNTSVSPTKPQLETSVKEYKIFIADLITSPNPERVMQQSRRYFVAGVLVTSFYCVPVFQLIFGFRSVGALIFYGSWLFHI